MKLLLFSVHNFSQIPGHFVKKHIFNAVFTYRSWPKLVHWRSYCANARFLWHFYKMKASKTVIRELLFTLCTAVVRKWKMYVFVKVLYVEQRKCHFFPEMQMNDYTILCQIRFFWPLLLLSIESSIFWGQTCLANKQNSEKKCRKSNFPTTFHQQAIFFSVFFGRSKSLTDCCSIFKTEKNGLGTRAANDRREVQYTQKSCKLRWSLRRRGLHAKTQPLALLLQWCRFLLYASMHNPSGWGDSRFLHD